MSYEIETHYQEPVKDKHQWFVNTIETKTGKVIKKTPYHTEKLAWAFLETKNFYLDGKLIHSTI